MIKIITGFTNFYNEKIITIYFYIRVTICRKVRRRFLYIKTSEKIDN